MSSDELIANCLVLEQATHQLQNPNASIRATAEKNLLALKQLKTEKLFQLVSYTVASTSDVSTRFHAVQTLRSAIIDRWSGTPEEVKQHILDWSIQSALSQRDEIVRSQMLACCTIILKRGWLEKQEVEKHLFFDKLRKHAKSLSDFAIQVELEFIQSVISEFSYETASSIGMPFTFHHACKKSLEDNFLLPFFEYACSKGREAFIHQQHGHDSSFILIACLETIMLILSWDFRKRVPTSFFSGRGSDEGYLSLKPGEKWREALLGKDSLQWAFELCTVLHTKSIETPIALSLRQLLVVLATLHGDIFMSENDNLQIEHLRKTIQAIMEIADPVQAVMQMAMNGQNEQRLTDGCQMIFSLSESNKLSALSMVSNSLGQEFDDLLVRLTLACIQCGGSREDNVDSCLSSSLAFLLDAWSNFIQDECTGNNGLCSNFSKNVSDGCVHILRAFVESMLMEAAETAFDDLDENEEEQGLEMKEQKLIPIAAIARVSAGLNFRFLSERLALCQQQLAYCKSETERPPILEQFCCLLEIITYCLADSTPGEVPLIPILLTRAHDIAVHENTADPTLQLSFALVETAAKVLGGTQDAIASPRTMEVMCKCISIWSATYLMPDEGTLPLAIQNAYGDLTHASNVINIVIQLAGAGLTRWPCEGKVQEHVCKDLLPVLVGGRKRRTALMAIPSWQQFITYCIQGYDEMTTALRSDLHRSLFKCLAKAASPPIADAVARQYLQGVLSPIMKSMMALQSQGVVSIQQIECFLEGLRGVTKGCSGIGIQYVLEIMFTLQPILLDLLSKYHSRSARIPYLVIKLVAELLEVQIAYLNSETFSRVYNFVYSVLKIYKSNNIGQISLRKSRTLKAEESSEKYKDIRALLKLLMSITDREMVDFSNSNSNFDIAQAIFVGLEMVFPLLSLELLSFPKLSHQYFCLIGHMCEVYPEKVCTLPKEIFKTLVETLTFGIQSNDFENVRSSIDAIYYVVKFHLEDMSRGGHGLGANYFQENFNQSLLALFMKSIFHKLVYEDYPSSLIDQSASVLLVLMIGESQAFQEIGMSILNGQQHLEHRNALQNTLNGLASSVSLHSGLSRQNRRKFSKEFQSFIIDIRGVVKSM